MSGKVRISLLTLYYIYQIVHLNDPEVWEPAMELVLFFQF